MISLPVLLNGKLNVPSIMVPNDYTAPGRVTVLPNYTDYTVRLTSHDGIT